MKILHLIQKRQLRGAEVFTSQLSNHLNDEGHEAVIVPIFGGNSILPFKGKIIELGGAPSKKYWDFKAWKRLSQIIIDEKPDIIQANAGDTLKYAIFSKLLFGWKQPVVFRNASTISLYIKSAWVKKLYRFLFSRTAKIVSVSHASAKDFGNLFPECKSKVEVIPIGINEDERVAYKLFQNPFGNVTGPILVHVGGFSFEKNHKGLIRIFTEVLKKVPTAQLHLIGDGPLKHEIESFVSTLGLQDKVVFHGFQNDPLEFMQFADALLLPSIIEGLPGVILEAFYSKLPVIANNVGGIGEVVIENETGYLIEKGNEKAFAEAVIECVIDDQKKESLVNNAYKLVTMDYLNKHIAKKFLNIYQQCAEIKKSISRESVTEH